MRKLAAALGIEAMSLCYHVTSLGAVVGNSDFNLMMTWVIFARWIPFSCCA